MRKKAKYLEDTPAEALVQDTAPRGRPHAVNSRFLQRPLPESADSRNLYAHQSDPPPYPMYSTPEGPLNLSQPSVIPSISSYPRPQQSLALHGDFIMAPQSYSTGDYPGGSLQPDDASGTGSIQQTSFDDLFPQSFDMGAFDFSNFDSRYGAAEFGMLNHMSVGMAFSPRNEPTFHPIGGIYTPNTMTTIHEQSPSGEAQISYQLNPALGQRSNDSQPDVRPTSSSYSFAGQSQDLPEGLGKQENPLAFAIGNSAVPSPTSMSSPQGMALAGSFDETSTNKGIFINPDLSSNQPQLRVQSQVQPQPAPHFHQQPDRPVVPPSTTSTPTAKAQTVSSRRPRNTSTVYEDVTMPYSYTTAFHNLAALIQRRFSPHKTAHIAKALAAIRPSFISCTMKLNKDDLVFMEKCLQRTLWEYEDFISATGTPTIICRRTGEIVAVGKEFSILTGWSANVLLGREPNLNVNNGGENPMPVGSGDSSRFDPLRDRQETRPVNAVNIVDLLDDDSVCDFFTDYAHLAFGDSRGSVITPCKLIKYQAANFDVENTDDEFSPRLKRRHDDAMPNRNSTAQSHTALHQLGRDDGKVDCMLCWSVKRDVFDIPMLCVMNVSLVCNL